MNIPRLEIQDEIRTIHVLAEFLRTALRKYVAQKFADWRKHQYKIVSYQYRIVS